MNIDERNKIQTGKIFRIVLLSVSLVALGSILLKSILTHIWNPFQLTNVPELVLFICGTLFFIYELILRSSNEQNDERTKSIIFQFYFRYSKLVLLLVLIGYITSISFININDDYTAFPFGMFLSFSLYFSFIMYYILSKREKIYLFEKYLFLPRRKYIHQVLRLILKVFIFFIILTIYGLLIRYLRNGISMLNFVTVLNVYSSLVFEIAFGVIIVSSYERIHYSESVIEEEKRKVPLLSKTYLVFLLWMMIASIPYEIANIISNRLSLSYLTSAPTISQIQSILMVIALVGSLTSVLLIIPNIISSTILYKSVKKTNIVKKGILVFLLIFIFFTLIVGFLNSLYGVLGSFNLVYYLIGIEGIKLVSSIQRILVLISMIMMIVFIIILMINNINSWIYILLSIALTLVTSLIQMIQVQVLGVNYLESTTYLVVTLLSLFIGRVITFMIYYSLSNQQIEIKETLTTE